MKNIISKIGKKGIMAIAAGALALTVTISGTYAWFTFSGTDLSQGSTFKTSTVSLKVDNGPNAKALKFANADAGSSTLVAQGELINLFQKNVSDAEKLADAQALFAKYFDKISIDGIRFDSTTGLDTDVKLVSYGNGETVSSSSILYSNIVLDNTSTIATYMKMVPNLQVNGKEEKVPVMAIFTYTDNNGNTKQGLLELGSDNKTLYAADTIPAGSKVSLTFIAFLDPNLGNVIPQGSDVKLGVLDKVELIQAENNAVKFADGWKDSGVSFR